MVKYELKLDNNYYQLVLNIINSNVYKTGTITVQFVNNEGHWCMISHEEITDANLMLKFLNG